MLRVSAGEAARRVRAAEQLVSGCRCWESRWRLCGQCWRRRSARAESRRIRYRVLVGLKKVDRTGFDPTAIAAGEETLAGLAGVFGPKDLQTCVDRFVDTLDPDGSRPEAELNADRRFFDLRAQRDGSWRGEFRLTGPAGAKLAAVLGPLAKPRPSTIRTPDGRLVEEVDPRHRGQRMHDALEEVCDRLLRTGTVPSWGGVPATVVVTITEESLRTRTGCGTTSDGTRLRVDQVLQLAGEAGIVPAVLSDTGAVLTLGCRRRIASRDQTLALIARDRGCSFPGCERPPAWCERHHIVAWADAG